MSRSISKLHRRLSELKGSRKTLKRQKKETKENLEAVREDIICLEKAQIIIQEVAFLTQEQLEFQISELVSMAMAAVFPEPYKLKLEFVVKRDRTQAELWFERDGD